MTALLDTRSPATTARMNVPPAPPVAAKGWHDDPWRNHDLRYHDGTGWTEHVTHFGPVPCPGCRGTR
ncbi:MAG: DUF2510 domain-containing protein [Acidimicrobiia bacterium]|nr:DUF2510 domain-containing protein [Acidimicrobiia bacterium]